MSPLHLDPPGPPQNFEVKVFSDTEIYLTWIALILPIPAAYEICYSALTPECVGGPVSVYCKRRKFQGVINFVVFADATIPQNLILGQRVAIN